MVPKVSVEHAKKVEEKIIQSARKQFAKKGYSLASMDEIAKSANVSKGGLYHHFPSKEELFVSLCGQNQQDLQQSFSGLFQKKENLMLDLGKFYDILYSSDRTLEQIWLTVMAEAQRNPKIKAIIIRQRQQSEQWVTGFLMQIWQGIGLFKDYKDNDLKIIAKGMIALVQGTTLDRLTLKDKNATKKAYVKTMYAIFSGSR
jgi:AcrR family transcriptional regulator